MQNTKNQQVTTQKKIEIRMSNTEQQNKNK